MPDMPPPSSRSSDASDSAATPMSSAGGEGGVSVAGPSLLRAAGLIAAVTLFSKVLGLVRDWAIMYAYGTSVVSDAYFAAFQLPAFAIVLLGGLGGPFHTTTVSVFARLLKDAGPPSPQAKLLASAFMTMTGLGFTLLSVLVFVFAEPIMGFILSQTKPELVQLSAAQLRVMSPCILVGGLVGILYGLSNLYHCFFWPSLSPVAMSLAIVAGLFLFPDPSGMVLAWATLAGAGLQLLMQLPEFFRQRFSLKPTFGLWRSPEMRQAGEMLGPAAISTTIGQLITYVDMFWASTLVHGAWAAVTLSNRLIQLPVGVLQTALLVPIFPRFSRAAAEGDLVSIKRDFKTGVVALWMMSIPILVLMLLYTEPLIRLLFQHGNFTAESTAIVTQALVFQAFQMLPYFARDSITRVFLAFQDSKTPMLVGVAAIAGKAMLNALLVPVLGVAGITLGITLITLMNMLLLGWLSKRHVADLGFREMVVPFVKLLLAGVAMAVIMMGLQQGIEATWPDAHIRHTMFSWQAYAVMALVSMVGIGVYLIVALGLRVAEAQYLHERLGRVLSRRLNR